MLYDITSEDIKEKSESEKEVIAACGEGSEKADIQDDAPPE